MSYIEKLWGSVNDAVSSLDLTDGWTIIGVVSAFVLTNWITIWSFRHQSNAERNLSIEAEKRRSLREELNNFYLPMLAKINFNRNLFQKIRNYTFPNITNGMNDREIYRAEAIRNETTRNWIHIRNNIILPMNEDIKFIIESMAIHINERDSIDNYLKLHAHIIMYKQFQEFPSEIYENYQFPDKTETHLREMIKDIKCQIKELS